MTGTADSLTCQPSLFQLFNTIQTLRFERKPFVLNSTKGVRSKGSRIVFVCGRSSYGIKWRAIDIGHVSSKYHQLYNRGIDKIAMGVSWLLGL